jgi:ATP-dependent DNA ligase
VLLDGPVSAMLATPGRSTPIDDGWVLEPKWDGWRALAHVAPTGPRTFTRHGKAHHRVYPHCAPRWPICRPARCSTASSCACNRSTAGACAAFDALVCDGWERTVANRTSGRYRCGRRTNAWLKLKSPAIERDRRRVAVALRWAA